jgi:ribonucleoside-triphosphate reductase
MGLSRLRAAGTPLKTFGGRSSGPEPLNALFEFSCGLFRKAAGRRLTTLECHDLGLQNC